MIRYTEIIRVNGQDVEMKEDVDARSHARLMEFESAAGNDRVFLSFDERITWAASDESIDDILGVMRQRSARHSSR